VSALGVVALMLHNCMAPIPASEVSTGPAGVFEISYLGTLTGLAPGCLASVQVWDTKRLMFDARAGCKEKAAHDRTMGNLATPGIHKYKVVSQGLQNTAAGQVYIGPAPQFTPAATVCSGSDSLTILLNPAFGLGHLPGGMMSDHRDHLLEPGEVLSHEVGHAATCGLNDAATKQEALLSENAYRLHRYGRNAPQRLFHDWVATR
jgi:hypothetical protein